MSDLCESDVLRLIRARWSHSAQGGERYVVMGGVRGKAGFMGYGSAGVSRTFDAIVVDTWESSGLMIHALEVKVARSDWLRELATPEKGADALRVADTMSVVAPPGVVSGKDELPDGWGWYEVQDGQLRTRRKPTAPAYERAGGYFPCGPAVDRHFVVGMLRAAYRSGGAS